MSGHVWPERLTLRDTKIHADEGQRIYTTATGYGYEKREYVRADASSQAEIERLRAALDMLLAIAPDTLGCGRRCSAEIDEATEADYALGLRFARAALSGSKE
jgi:hypothetical protein